MTTRWLVLSCGLSLACTVPSSGIGNTGGFDAALADGGVDGGTDDAGVDGARDSGGVDAPADTAPDVPPDAACEEGVTRCSGDVLEACSGGAFVEVLTCPLGCRSDPVAACGSIDPSNVLDGSLVSSGSADFVVPADHTYRFNTETGEIENLTDSEIVRADGSGDRDGVTYQFQGQGDPYPSLGIFAFGSLRVETNATVVTTGDYALVLLAARDITIDGVLDVSANGLVGGAGGYNGGERRNAGQGPGGGGRGDIDGFLDSEMGGGGGGGHRAAGGEGGDHNSASGGSAGPSTDDDKGIPLVGGSGGGAGANAGDGGRGGGGGGAVQLTANGTIRVNDGAILRASGAGGGRDSRAGGGGGAGGTILLEAPAVITRGIVVANGGGGASGTNGLGGSAERGDDGRDDRMRAAGGTDGGGGDGGRGGAADTPSGENGDNGSRGGGGGGAAGDVHVNALPGGLDIGGTVSPDHTEDAVRAL
ncbi:MAG: hypothetical protein AAGE52_03650 [Myxococcota bacterium]